MPRLARNRDDSDPRHMKGEPREREASPRYMETPPRSMDIDPRHMSSFVNRTDPRLIPSGSRSPQAQILASPRVQILASQLLRGDYGMRMESGHSTVRGALYAPDRTYRSTLMVHNENGAGNSATASSQNSGHPFASGANYRWWIPGDGIRRDVLQADIQRYLGPEALVRPGEGRDENRVCSGYRLLS